MAVNNINTTSQGKVLINATAMALINSARNNVVSCVNSVASLAAKPETSLQNTDLSGLRNQLTNALTTLKRGLESGVYTTYFAEADSRLRKCAEMLSNISLGDYRSTLSRVYTDVSIVQTTVTSALNIFTSDADLQTTATTSTKSGLATQGLNPVLLDTSGIETLDSQSGGAYTGTHSYVSDYSSPDKKERLINVKVNDGSLDDQNLAYLKLLSGATYPDLEGNAEKQYLDSLLSELKDKYTKFIVTGIQESRSEKSQIISTFGDYYAATFTGREPTVLVVSGMLVFDYGSATQAKSWYEAFIDAYEYYLRASRLAKWRASLRLYFGDGFSYEGYILNLSTSAQSDNDVMIPMSFSLLIKDKWAAKPLVTTTGSAVGGKGDEVGKGVAGPAADSNKLTNILDLLNRMHDSVSSERNSLTTASSATSPDRSVVKSRILSSSSTGNFCCNRAKSVLQPQDYQPWFTSIESLGSGMYNSAVDYVQSASSSNDSALSAYANGTITKLNEILEDIDKKINAAQVDLEVHRQAEEAAANNDLPGTPGSSPTEVPEDYKDYKVNDDSGVDHVQEPYVPDKPLSAMSAEEKQEYLNYLRTEKAKLESSGNLDANGHRILALYNQYIARVESSKASYTLTVGDTSTSTINPGIVKTDQNPVWRYQLPFFTEPPFERLNVSQMQDNIRSIQLAMRAVADADGRDSQHYKELTELLEVRNRIYIQKAEAEATSAAGEKGEVHVPISVLDPNPQIDRMKLEEATLYYNTIDSYLQKLSKTPLSESEKRDKNALSSLQNDTRNRIKVLRQGLDAGSSSRLSLTTQAPLTPLPMPSVAAGVNEYSKVHPIYVIGPEANPLFTLDPVVVDVPLGKSMPPAVSRVLVLIKRAQDNYKKVRATYPEGEIKVKALNTYAEEIVSHRKNLENLKILGITREA